MKLSVGTFYVALVLLLLAWVAPIAHAEEYASKERADAALGHYARARSMLVEALAEFEEGRRIARPDMLIDSEEWRLSVVSRTEELNRLLDPQPRVTRSGVRFKAVGRFIRREHQRPAPVVDGAQDSNTYGEEQRKRELEMSREQPVEPGMESQETVGRQAPAAPVARVDNERKALVDEETKQLIDEKAAEQIPPAAAEAVKKNIQATPAEDDMSLAIERAVKARLKETDSQLRQDKDSEIK